LLRWRSGSPGRRRGEWTGLWIVLFLLPFLVLYLGFTLWPLIATILYSFFDWDGISPLRDFVGIRNYIEIAKDPVFWESFRNTFVFAIANTVVKLSLSLLMAILLTKRWLKLKSTFRAVFFIPFVLPVSLAGLIFTYLLNPSNGALNSVLHSLGVAHGSVDLLGHDQTALATVIGVSVWQVFGEYLIYWMAALQNVPDELYEAAELDGASEWQKLVRITLPLIRPVALIIALLAVINALHVFALIVTLTAGGPGTNTYVVSFFIYQQAFQELPFRYGYASAAAVLFAALALALVTSQGLIVKRVQAVRRETGI
jgi:ABC-type sugar transport system permease subunit